MIGSYTERFTVPAPGEVVPAGQGWFSKGWVPDVAGLRPVLRSGGRASGQPLVMRPNRPRTVCSVCVECWVTGAL